MPMNEIDIDHLVDKSTAKTPEYRLWLAVTLDAIHFLLNSRFPTTLSESFLFDPDNDFFNFVADGLGYSPDGLRERIKKAWGRKNEGV